MKRIVLLVDDDRDILNLAMRKFSADARFAGVERLPCATYEEAIIAYLGLTGAEMKQTVLVTDYDLDGKYKGDDVISKLVELKFTGPVLMMSGNLPDGEHEVDGRVFRVLHKPFSLRTWANAVHSLLLT